MLILNLLLVMLLLLLMMSRCIYVFVVFLWRCSLHSTRARSYQRLNRRPRCRAMPTNNRMQTTRQNAFLSDVGLLLYLAAYLSDKLIKHAGMQKNRYTDRQDNSHGQSDM